MEFSNNNSILIQINNNIESLNKLFSDFNDSKTKSNKDIELKKTLLSENMIDKLEEIYNLFYSLSSNKIKKNIHERLFTIIYLIWSAIDIKHKKEYITKKSIDIESSEENKSKQEEIKSFFNELDLISEWAKYNSIYSSNHLEWLILTLDAPNTVTNNGSKKFLEKILDTINKMNLLLEKNPYDIDLVDYLFNLVVFFNQLELMKDLNDNYVSYYIKLYETIIILWKHVNTNISKIEDHNHYPYLYLFMKNIDKIKNANKNMNKITRSVLRNMGKMVPRNPQNANNLYKDFEDKLPINY